MDEASRIFSVALERQIMALLQGDKESVGLYRMVIQGVDDLRRYDRLCGEIKALEAVVQLIHETNKRMYEDATEMLGRRAGVH